MREGREERSLLTGSGDPGNEVGTNPTSIKLASRWRLLQWLVPECVFRVLLEQDWLFRASDLIKVSYKYFA